MRALVEKQSAQGVNDSGSETSREGDEDGAQVPDLFGHRNGESHDACAKRNFGHIPHGKSISGLLFAHWLSRMAAVRDEYIGY